MHEICIRLFLWRYNTERAQAYLKQVSNQNKANQQ